MKASDWLAVAGLVASLMLAGATAWTNLSARISSMEEDLRQKEKVIALTREIVIGVMKDVHELKGVHAKHKHTGAKVDDDTVMAEAWLKDSEM